MTSIFIFVFMFILYETKCQDVITGERLAKKATASTPVEKNLI